MKSILVFLLLLFSSTVSAGNHYYNCSDEQISQLKEASAASLIMLDNSIEELNKAISNNDSKLTSRWFGDNNPVTIKRNYKNMHKVLDEIGVLFDCEEMKNETGLYAMVYKDNPFVIFLAPLFWKAPLTGYDSKAGVLIHELSHFSETAESFDIAANYQSTLYLRSISILPIYNANSYEYFSEEVDIHKKGISMEFFMRHMLTPTD